MLPVDPVGAANLATAVVLISTSIIPIGLGLMIRSPPIALLKRGVMLTRTATILLGLFLLVHGFYHVAEFVGNDFFSDDILEPLSIFLLLSFTLYVWQFIYVPKNHSAKLAKSILPVIAFPIAVAYGLSILTPFVQNVAETFTLFGILLSTLIFSWMVAKNPSPYSLHFDFAIIVLIWACSEIPHSLVTFGFVNLGSVDLAGTWLHFVSMLFIGLLICFKSFQIMLSAPRSAKTLTYNAQTGLDNPAK